MTKISYKPNSEDSFIVSSCHLTKDKREKKRSYFLGFHNLVMMKLISMFFFFFILIVHQTSMAKGENQLFGFSSREDLVQLAGYGEEKLSTVLVTGTLLCQACLHSESQRREWPISGALVSVKCHTNGKRIETSSAQAITDEYGDFLVDLPSHLHAIPNLEKTCSVRVLRMPKNSACQPAYFRKQMALTLSSAGNGIRNYSTGTIKLLRLTSKPLQACTKRANNDKQITW